MAKVLIVEDDPINMLIATKLLGKHFAIETAKNGNEALKVVGDMEFDVILMDINLGDDNLDGVEVMKRIKTDLKKEQVKIYAVTSYAMPEDRERFLNEGFDKYFPKPINKNEIIESIQAEINAN